MGERTVRGIEGVIEVETDGTVVHRVDTARGMTMGGGGETGGPRVHLHIARGVVRGQDLVRGMLAGNKQHRDRRSWALMPARLTRTLVKVTNFLRA